MQVGDRVRFIRPEPDEEGVIFEVLEDRDDRVLVTAVGMFDDWTIRPTSVYQKADLEIARQEETEA